MSNSTVTFRRPQAAELRRRRGDACGLEKFAGDGIALDEFLARPLSY